MEQEEGCVILERSWETSRPAVPTWRLRLELLEDAAFRASLSAVIPENFELNDGTASSSLVEWDTFKVFVRGHCLGTQCNQRRSIERDLTRVERVLLRPEGEVTGNQTETSTLTAVRAEHLLLLERLRCLNYAAHSARTHDSADKAGKLLAWLIR
ncbi:hypothetical protein NDU88_003610 [Pleurodeles waltl]|uniref:Uncharacterized protein n=1 Tax=Pleurodeles waltl TaxID=8319 RepID=A0AAV7RH70_PLEWA|nr:hypothetical protein NDU88_003610 [Pleurodeles waltl]